MNHTIARTNMLKQQLRTGDVVNDAILQLYETINREDFVPTGFIPFAYSDVQIALPHGQCMMTPLEEGRLLQSLDLKGHETVLEVGTGTGFLTALLSRLCKHVISVDIFPEFTEEAQQKLNAHDCNNVSLFTADAAQGFIEKAPYDVIVMTGGIERVSETLRLQVLPHGKLFAIIGQKPIMQAQLFLFDEKGQWKKQVIFETYLPPLIDKLKTKTFIF